MNIHSLLTQLSSGCQTADEINISHQPCRPHLITEQQQGQQAQVSFPVPENKKMAQPSLAAPSASLRTLYRLFIIAAEKGII
jgi:hypothetical protein